MNLIGLLIVLLIFCIVLWAARALMAAFGVGDPIATVVYVVIVIIGLLWLVSALGYGGAIGAGIPLRGRRWATPMMRPRWCRI
jgi:hypothetical protein